MGLCFELCLELKILLCNLVGMQAELVTVVTDRYVANAQVVHLLAHHNAVFALF